MGIAAGHTLDLVRRVGRRVYLDRALGAAERHVDDGALEGHERGQRHHLVLVHLGAVADAALERESMVTVLRTPRAYHLEGAVGEPHREVEA